MDGYLNYKINLNTTSLMEVEEFTPNDIGTYDSLISLGEDWNQENRETLSSSIELVDAVIGSYVLFGSNGYLNTTNHQNNFISETANIGNTSLTVDFYGTNLLSGSLPLELTSANFNYANEYGSQVIFT